MERTHVFAAFASIALVSLACKGFGDKATADAGITTTTAAKSTDVTFVKKIAKPGAKFDTQVKTGFKFTFAGKLNREDTETVATIEVQASDEFRVTKAAIDVKKLVVIKQEGTGDEHKSVNPLSGSRYIVSRSDDGKLSALDSAGSPVGAAMLAEIKEHFGDVVERDKTRDFLPQRPIKIGEKLTPANDVVLKLVGQKDDGTATVDGVDFSLQSATADKATFSVSMTITIKIDPQIRMRAKLDGTIDVAPKDSEVTAVSLKGPITLLDPKGAEKGTGELSFSGTESAL